MFVRAFGSTYKALYVGQAKNLRSRVKGHLKTNVKLMNGIKNSPQGHKFLVFGEFKSGKGLRLESSLDRIERALIRHYIDAGHELFNTHGTRVAMECLTSDRPQRMNSLIPRTVRFQKQS